MTGTIDPLHQFAIERMVPLHFAGFDISFTNSALFMALAVLATSFLMRFALQAGALHPSRRHMAVETLHGFVFDTARGALGERDARRYMPVIFSLFLFVLGCNAIGLLPYSFTPTSHLAITGSLALSVFFGVTILGLVKNGVSYLKIFVPSGLPVFIMPLMIIVELVSYCARPLTHSMRLFANMVAGHVMMKVLASFVVMMGPVKGGFLPLSLMVAVTALELLVAFLQAYVFTAMTCLYLKDALNPHH